MAKFKKYKSSGKTKKYRKNARAKKAELGDVLKNIGQIGVGLGTAASPIGGAQALTGGIGAVKGIFDMIKAGRDLKRFDKSKLIPEKSTTLAKMKGIDPAVKEASEDLQQARETSALQAAQRGGAATLQSSIDKILRSGAAKDIATMKEEDAAKRAIDKMKVAEEAKRAAAKSAVAEAELQGIRERAKAGIEGVTGAIKETGAVSQLLGEGAGKNVAESFLGITEESAKGSVVPKLYKKGDIFPKRKTVFPKKGEAITTPGKFSHKKNPIDIVAKEGEVMDVVQKNKKIGEMTGNETIINPSDTKKILSFLDKNNEKELFDFVKKLYNRFLKK
tara:strand:- start:257 stop:1255 length:999 start_codon:yes stop_codon:yes gene_type:complete